MEKVNIKARHRARRLIMQAIYQWTMTAPSISVLVNEFCAQKKMQTADEEYFKTLLSDIINKVEELDALIATATDRNVSTLDVVELSVLRLSVYELKYRLDIPYKVAINEALELAKAYGAEEGFKFVNGVLDKLARDLRPTEV